MEIIDAAVALLIGYFAFKGFRLTKEKIFLYLHFSFILLGVGFLADGLTTRMLLVRPSKFAIFVANFGYVVLFITELIAYSLLIFAYIQQTKKLASSPRLFVPPILAQYGPIPETIIFCLTTYITIQCAVNYSVRKDRNSLLVLFGFTMIAASHAVFPFLKFSGLLFILAHSMQLIGFLSLLAMLLQVLRSK